MLHHGANDHVMQEMLVETLAVKAASHMFAANRTVMIYKDVGALALMHC